MRRKWNGNCNGDRKSIKGVICPLITCYTYKQRIFEGVYCMYKRLASKVLLFALFCSMSGYDNLGALAADKKSAGEGGKSFSGKASWYGPGFNGRKTASGEIFDMNKLSAAHKKLPFKTKLQVEDPRTGNTVIVKVNDRGPFVKTRVLDMSKGAAVKLGTISHGVTFVDCLVLDDD